MMDHLQYGRPDLFSHLLPESDATVYTEGSSYIRDGIYYARAAVAM